MGQILVTNASGGQQSVASVPNTGRLIETDALPVLIADTPVLTGVGLSATNNVIAPDGASATSVAAYQSGVLQVTSTATSGTYIAEQSVDGQAWVVCPLFEVSTGTPTALITSITATATTRIFRFSIGAPFFRVRIATSLNNSGANFFASFSYMPYSGVVQLIGTISAGTNAIGDVGTQYRANATGAASVANVNCPATPAAQSIKASAGRMLAFVLTNSAASTRWLKVFNTAAGSVTLGTTSAIYELAIPPGSTVNVDLDGGIGFSTAIVVAITGGQGLTNNTAVTLGDVTGFIAFA